MEINMQFHNKMDPGDYDLTPVFSTQDFEKFYLYTSYSVLLKDVAEMFDGVEDGTTYAQEFSKVELAALRACGGNFKHDQ
jgi:hypothetical protein